MPVYEIINPSDPYTLECDDLAVATLAVVLLGRGHYGLNDENDQNIVPIMLFGDSGSWFQQQFGKTLEELLKATSKDKIADCLDSVIYGSFGDRRRYLTALNLIDDPEKQAEWARTWHDQRSSLNDIGGRAKRLAAHLRGG